MTIEDDKNVLAAEYVLGTLDADERALAEELIALDPGFEIIMRSWERRLGELSAMVDPVEPPAHVWERLRAQLPQRSEAPVPPIPATLEVSPPADPAAAEEEIVEPPAAEPEPVRDAEEATAADGIEVPLSEHDLHRWQPSDRQPPTAVPSEQPATANASAEQQAQQDPRPEPAAQGEDLQIASALAGLRAVAESLAPQADAQRREAQVGDDAKEPPAHMPQPGPARPEPKAAVPPGAEVARLSRRVNRWRAIAVLVFLLGAGLVGLAAVRELAPERLPPALRPKPKIERVEVIKEVVKEVTVEKKVEVPSPKPAEFIAVLQKDEFSPAFLLTFDLNRRVLVARAVGAERQAGKSYELWLISDASATPRSLGVIGAEQFTQRTTLAQFDAVMINKATYAVTLEPEGGSPSGVPTGPFLYKGKLLQATPLGLPMQTP